MTIAAALNTSQPHFAISSGAPTRDLPRVAYRMCEIPAATGMGLSTAYRDVAAGKLKASTPAPAPP